MIRVFSPNDKIFTSNGDAVIQPFKAKVHKEDNGKFYLDIEADISYVDILTANGIIVADTPQGAQALKELVTHYPVTNISVNSEQLDGYTVFNYPISMQNGWNYVKQQLNDNRDYIYDMDLQSAEAYINSEYAVTLTELEV